MSTLYSICRCGYQLSEYDQLDGSRAIECSACGALWFLQPAGIDDDGPHGERLVPVEGEVT